ncbi:MAG: hypothetical protein MMC23_005634 [Stictis urceolatum]|nr:hypothetical protein [Stictis urceolata]
MLVLYPRNLIQYESLGHDGLYARVHENTRDARISLFHDNNSSHHSQSMFEAHYEDFDFPHGKQYLPYTQPDIRRNFTMHNTVRTSIARFVNDLINFKRIESFRLRISDKGSPSISVERRAPYPYQPLVMALTYLSTAMPSHLTTLEISLDNEAFAFVGGSQPHLCPLIARFLPTVRNMAFHLESTCPEVLRLSDDDGKIGLERLIINADPRADSRRHELGFWNGCQPSRSAIGRFFSLQQEELVEAGKELVKRMKEPKLVRILFGIGPNSQELVSVDCISGKEMRLTPGQRPFEDGEVVENGAQKLSHYAQFWNRRL